MKIINIIIIELLLTSCLATMPNTISEIKSSFDGKTQYEMQPGFIYSDASFGSWGSFKLGLLWNKPDKNITIKAVIPNKIVNISHKDGLQFNIDGQIIKLSSPDIVTDFYSDIVSGVIYKGSSISFVAEKSIVVRLLSAKTVKVRLVTRSGLMESDFKADKPSAAIRGFRDFSEKLRQ